MSNIKLKSHAHRSALKGFKVAAVLACALTAALFVQLMPNEADAKNSVPLVETASVQQEPAAPVVQSILPDSPDMKPVSRDGKAIRMIPIFVKS